MAFFKIAGKENAKFCNPQEQPCPDTTILEKNSDIRDAISWREMKRNRAQSTRYGTIRCETAVATNEIPEPAVPR